MRFSPVLLSLLALTALFAGAGDAQNIVEVQIGDVFPANLSTPHPYAPPVREGQPVWSAPIQHRGGWLIKVHLTRIDLGPEDYVVIRDAKGNEVDRITAREANPLREIWALSVPGELAVVELWAGPGGGGRYGFDIDRYAWIWDPNNKPGIDSTCLTNDRERIACYKDSPTKPASVFQHGRAVCGMARVNSTATFCSGALASRDGLFFTCNHCVSTQSSADSLEVWFDYEHASCSGSTRLPTIRIRGPHQMVWTSNCNDASLIRLNPSGVSAAGLDVPGTHDYLLNEPGPLTLNERCWVPGHPAGNPKEVSYQGNPTPQVTVTAKRIRCTGNNFFGHTADTTGGSSGSTVLNQENRRIGVHGYAGCNTSQPVGSNGAARMDLIWPQVQQHFMDWNQTIRMVPDGDDRSTPVGNGTPIPFNTSEARTQTLFEASDLGRRGPIHEIALASTSLTTIRIARLEVRMAHRSQTGLSTIFKDNLAQDATVVFDGPLTWNVVNDGWVKLGLKTPFDYNGADNLVVEYRVKGLTGGTLFHSGWQGNASGKPIRNHATGPGSFDATTAAVTNEAAGMKHRFYFAYRPRAVTVPESDPVSPDPAGTVFKSSEARCQWFIPRDMMAAHGSLVGLTWAGSETGLLGAQDLEVRIAATASTGFGSSFATNIAGAQTVFSAARGDLRLVKGQWHGLPFASAFTYDGTGNLVVEVRYRGGSGGARCYRNTDGTNGVKRAIATGAGAYSAATASTVDTAAPKLRFLFANATRVKPGAARVGQIMNLTWSAPDFAGKAYLGAAAFDAGPGIQLPGDDTRVVPLNLDPLFVTSLSNPAIFRGFTGTLSASGEASGQVVIPSIPALAGVGFYLGLVVVDPTAGVPTAIADVGDSARVVIQS